MGSIFDQTSGEPDIYRAFLRLTAMPVGVQGVFPERLQYQHEYNLPEHPTYSFRISERDLARVGQLFLQQGEWEGGQILPAGWVEESTQAYSTTGNGGAYRGYGYLWWVAAESWGDIETGSCCASGLGGHTMEVLPRWNTVIVVRFNTDVTEFENLAGAPIDRLIQRILEARVESQMQVARWRRVAAPE